MLLNMARIVVFTEQKPVKLLVEGQYKLMCMCGISKNRPFCDMSHIKTHDEKEGVCYVYDENNRHRVDCDVEDIETKNSDNCCGGSCCG